MKKSIIAALVLVACVLLAPFGFGKLAEKRVNAGLEKAVADVPVFVIAENTWKGGYFRSSQDVRFELAPGLQALINCARSDEASKPIGFTLHNAVVHGPVLGKAGFGLARIDTTADLPEEFQAEIRKIFGAEPALEVYTRVAFFKGATTVMTSTGRVIKPEGEDFEISYDTFKLALGGDAKSFDMDGGLPRFEVKGDAGQHILVSDITIDGDGKLATRYLFDSDMAFRVGEVKVTAPGGNATVKDIHFVAEDRVKDGLYSSSGKIGTGAIESPELAALAGLSINEVHYDLGVHRLHAESIDKIIDAVIAFLKNPPTTCESAQLSAAVQAALLKPLMDNAAELLKHNPEYSLDRVGVVTSEGDAMLKGVIKLVGATLDDFTSGGGMALIGKIEADVTIEVAQKLIDKIPNGSMMSSMAISQGYAVVEGDKVVCHIEFKNGELKINGKAMPLPIPGMGGPPPGDVAPAPGDV